jgi:hypothetical protein
MGKEGSKNLAFLGDESIKGLKLLYINKVLYKSKFG